MIHTQPQLLPDYQGACVANLIPELIKQVMGAPLAKWMPQNLAQAKQVVLLVVDGLGWEQLQAKKDYLPTLAAFEGGSITSVAPTSTPTGLTSIVTARPPSVHGVLGYRVAVGENETLDLINWRVNGNDARARIEPTEFQVQPAFAANDITAVVERRHLVSGFTDALMQGARLSGYATPSGLPVEVWKLVAAGEPIVYAYYGGVDTVAHVHGMGEHYDAELYTVDRLLRDLMAGLPKGCALVVTSDHGQVEVGDRNLDIDEDIVAMCSMFSGEGRFRWLHAKPGLAGDLAVMCKERFDDLAWVMTIDELSDQGWFGGPIHDAYRARLGDVALIAAAPVAFKDPSHPGERNMISRHGSVTPAEMLVPMLGTVV